MDAHNLIFDFALVMLLLLLAPLASTRLRLPDIVGLILAGVLVGEKGLGIFHLDTTFQLLGSVGLLYLMFLAGLEINLNEFHRYRKPSLVFGILTFLVPMLLGTFGARHLLGYSWQKAILLASMFASHTLLPFSITQRLGISKNRAVTTTIGGTIFTDTAALLVLAVIVKEGTHGAAAMASDSLASFWGIMALSLTLLLFLALVLLPRLGYWFLRRVAPDGSSEFIFILAVVFLTAYAAELAGVEGIIGAFLAGLAMSSLVPERSVLTARLHFVGNALFIPFFLLSVGMRVDLRVFLSGLDGWTVSTFMVVGVTVSKWIAAELSGRVLGFDGDERGLVFGLSVNQAAATLAAVLVGHRVGIFDEAVLNGTIMMILVTCLIGPYFTERCARSVAEKDVLPVSTGTSRRDTGRVLVPIASAARVDCVMDLAMMLRPERCHEPLFPLNVVLDGPELDARVAESERLLGTAVARAAAAGVEVVPVTRIDLNVAGGVLRTALECRASSVLIGWRSDRPHFPFSSNVPELVIREAASSVVVFRPGAPLNTMKRLLVALPPLIERHPRISDAMGLIRRLAGQAGAKMLLHGTEATLSSVEGLEVLRGFTELKGRPHPSWQEAVAALEQARVDEDGLVLLSDRKGRLAWQPSLDRLPVDWATRWPEANLFVCYPARPGSAAEEALRDEASRIESKELDVAATCVENLSCTDLREAVRALIASVAQIPADHVAGMVDLVMKTGPVPLSKDIALTHAHLPDIAESLVMIATNDEGFSIGGFADRPTTLVVLLSPRGAPPEQHLSRLAAIARSALDGTLLQAGGAAGRR